MYADCGDGGSPRSGGRTRITQIGAYYEDGGHGEPGAARYKPPPFLDQFDCDAANAGLYPDDNFFPAGPVWVSGIAVSALFKARSTDVG